MRVRSTTGYTTLTSTPHLSTSGIVDGTEVILQGVSDTNYLRFQDESSLSGSGLQLDGSTDKIIALGDTLYLVYYLDLEK